MRFHIGVFAEIPVSNIYAFQPEIQLSRQGTTLELVGSETFSGDSQIFGVEIKQDSELIFTYLNIPLMQKFYVANRFNIQVGH